MKRIILFILTGLFLSAFMPGDEVVYKDLKYDNFGRGERLDYKVSFGIFTVGSAKMVIDDKFYKVNHRDCYKVDVYGKTSGMVSWVAKVDDHWGAYVDSAALVPHISYRNIKENKYRKNEIVRFDHSANMIEAKVKNKKTGEFKEPKLYVAPEDIRDMLAGYLYMRTVDFSKMKKNDRFRVSGFFEDEFYDLDVVFKGREKVKTKAGKFKAIKLVPVMPDNELFDGDDSIFVWISDDENKVPLKIEAKMFIGSAGLELADYKNVKHEMTSRLK